MSTVPLFPPIGSSQNITHEPIKHLYPAISSPVTVECSCGSFACDTVFWYRSISSPDRLQYLGRHNNADRSAYGPGVTDTKFKFSKRGNSFHLRINSVNKEDEGAYSCVLKDKNTDIWKPGSRLWPGGLYAEMFHIKDLLNFYVADIQRI